MAKPRVLIIKPVLPYPPNQGTRILSFEIIQTLAPHTELTVACRTVTDEDTANISELEKHCHRVVAVPAPNKKSLLHRIGFKLGYGLQSLLFRRSLKALYDCPAAFRRAVRQLDPESFDLIIVEYWQLFRMFPLLPMDKVVLLTHDIDWDKNRRAALLDKMVLSKIAKVRTWLNEKNEETAAYLTARNIWALTERDADAVREVNPKANVQVLPFGIDPERFPPPDQGVDRRERILFMGAMSAPFNIDALVYFAEKVMPHLDEFTGEIAIVGGELPEPARFLLADDRVKVVGRVPDVAPYLAESAAMVIPMRFGGGLRIRILEAMMAGLPLVCTTVAIAGMDFEIGRHYRHADRPEAIAAHLMDLVDDRESAQMMAQNARERVIGRYSTPVTRPQLVQMALDQAIVKST